MSEGILFVSGAALQWLRQFRWFSDGLVLLTALAFACVGVALQGPIEDWRVFLNTALSATPVVLGGTMAAHMASHTKVVKGTVLSSAVPTYNKNGGK